MSLSQNWQKKSYQKEEFDSTINTLDLINGELYNERNRINIFFKFPWNIYNTDDILAKKSSQKIFLIVEIMQTILDSYDAIKLNINNKKWPN